MTNIVAIPRYIFKFLSYSIFINLIAPIEVSDNLESISFEIDSLAIKRKFPVFPGTPKKESEPIISVPFLSNPIKSLNIKTVVLSIMAI